MKGFGNILQLLCWTTVILVSVAAATGEEEEKMTESVEVEVLRYSPNAKNNKNLGEGIGGATFADEEELEAGTPRLVRVNVESRFTLPLLSPASSPSSSSSSSYSYFPDFFAQLAKGVVAKGSEGKESSGNGAVDDDEDEYEALPLNSLDLEMCSGRWQPQWGKDDNSAPCRGHAVSAIFERKRTAVEGQPAQQINSKHPCSSWVRVLNSIGAFLSTSYTQVHPLDCEVSAGKSPYEGTTSATLVPVHKRHIYSTSDVDEKPFLDQRQLVYEKDLEQQRKSKGTVSGTSASGISATAGDGSSFSKLYLDEVGYYTQIPLEYFCTDNLAPLLHLIPGQQILKKETRRLGHPEEIEQRPVGVWSKFVPSVGVLFDLGFKRLTVSLRKKRSSSSSSSSSSSLELSIKLSYITTGRQFFEMLASSSVKDLSPASPFSSHSTLRFIRSSDSAPSSSSGASSSGGGLATTEFDLLGRKKDKNGANLAKELQALAGPHSDLARYNPTTKKGGRSNFSPDLQAGRKVEHCGVLKKFEVQQRGEIDGRIFLSLKNPYNGTGTLFSYPFLVRLVIPLHVMRPLAHTLRPVFEPKNNDQVQQQGQSLEDEGDDFKVSLARVEKNIKADTVTLTLEFSALKMNVRNMRAVMSFKPPFVNVNHYPPDANKAYWLPSAAVFYNSQFTPDGGGGGKCRCGQKHPHERGLVTLLDDDMYWAVNSGVGGQIKGVSDKAGDDDGSDLNQKRDGAWCVETSLEATVLSLPIPDVSMPFNVLAVACGVISLFYGAFYSMTARNSV